jgi:hypothetical protein
LKPKFKNFLENIIYIRIPFKYCVFVLWLINDIVLIRLRDKKFLLFFLVLKELAENVITPYCTVSEKFFNGSGHKIYSKILFFISNFWAQHQHCLVLTLLDCHFPFLKNFQSFKKLKEIGFSLYDLSNLLLRSYIHLFDTIYEKIYNKCAKATAVCQCHPLRSTVLCVAQLLKPNLSEKCHT